MNTNNGVTATLGLLALFCSPMAWSASMLDDTKKADTQPHLLGVWQCNAVSSDIESATFEGEVEYKADGTFISEVKTEFEMPSLPIEFLFLVSSTGEWVSDGVKLTESDINYSAKGLNDLSVKFADAMASQLPTSASWTLSWNGTTLVKTSEFGQVQQCIKQTKTLSASL
ncbi:hypothetical protein CS022_05865 [Veronia nyctiphanis]|uniref:Uncharacterized protein n=1 Tax=Veronia nyctiphanis TaxID=1278244 RepID=A0A4Q0YSG3_9GAMM|nr:hypothetical protein [Veronia nyctiphanis]RXJ74142.1 hypothetical protein CS022_05865 [Veronia nyctiphanis]